MESFIIWLAFFVIACCLLGPLGGCLLIFALLVFGFVWLIVSFWFALCIAIAATAFVVFILYLGAH